MKQDSELTPSEVTRLIDAARAGDKSAGDNLINAVYGELRGLAYSIFNERRQNHTLQPTALVHEAWMKLAGHLDSLEGKRHFFAVAARAMRQVLADHARNNARQKRGGKHTTVLFSQHNGLEPMKQTNGAIDLADFDEALTNLASLNERHARVAEMRLLGTMTIQEIADELKMSGTTIEKDWRVARAWLNRALQ